MKQTPTKPKETTPKEKKKVFKKPLPPTSQKKRATPKEKSPEESGDRASPEPQLKLFKSNYTSASPSIDMNRKNTYDLEAIERDDVEVYGLPPNRHGQVGPSNKQSNEPPSYYSDQPPFLTPRDANPPDSDESGDEAMEEEEEEEGDDEEEDDEEEEEDVDSCGEIDEEVAAVVERLTQKMKEQTLESISLGPRVPTEVTFGGGSCFSWNPQVVPNTPNAATTPLTVKTKKKKMVPAQYIYQLFSNEAIGYGLIDRKATFVTAMKTAPPGEVNETQAFLCDPRYTLLFEEFLKNFKKTPEGRFVTMYDNRFVLVKTLVPLTNILPKLFNRGMERDPARDPPILEEIIERVCLMPEESTINHPKAYRWPAAYSYTMVEYSEDPFWTERTIPIPEGIIVPPDPIDGVYERGDPPPPVDYDYVPPPGEPAIYIPPEAWALFRENKAKHERQVKADQEEKEKLEKQRNNWKSSKSKKARKH